MKITWLGHACFMVEHEDYTIVLDPFNPQMLPGLQPVEATADRVLCSHQHDDHNYVQAVQITESGAKPIAVTEISCWHDGEQGAQRGPNTVHILEAGGLKVAHLGDLGHLPDENLTKALSGVDVMLIPVGGYYTINAEMAKQVVSLTEPRVVIPMHYKGKGFGFPVLGSVEQFTNRFCSSTVRWYDTNVLEVTADTPHQIAVLQCPLAK